MSDIIIGDVPESMRGTVKEDCVRALYGRLDDLDQKGIISFSFVFPFIMSCVCIAHKRVIAYKISSKMFLGLPENYCLAKPSIRFTSIDFDYSRTSLQASHLGTTQLPPSSNECKSFTRSPSPFFVYIPVSDK